MPNIVHLYTLVPYLLHSKPLHLSALQHPSLEVISQPISLTHFLYQINPSVMEAALSPDMLATDLAYYLVRKGVSTKYPLKPGICVFVCS